MAKNLVLFVEDEDYAQKGLIGMMESGDYEILGPISNYSDAIRTIDKRHNEIMVGLIDLMLPEKDGDSEIDPKRGQEIARMVKNKGIPVIIVSAKPFPDILLSAAEEEMSYIIKRDITEHIIIQTIELAMAGCGVFSYQALGELARTLKLKNEKNPLTEEQWELFEERISGKTVNEIADKRKFAPSTISNRFTEIYAILGVSNQIEAIRWYQKNAEKYNRRLP